MLEKYGITDADADDEFSPNALDSIVSDDRFSNEEPLMCPGLTPEDSYYYADSLAAYPTSPPDIGNSSSSGGDC